MKHPLLSLLTAGLCAGAITAQAAAPEFSRGVYRIPYLDGTSVNVSFDHITHSPAPNRIDMGGTGGRGLYGIVAAADGVIRAIVDTNTVNCTTNSSCSDFNNYVWIEHPNGEWTKYSHMRTGSTTAAGRYVGEPVCAGTYLGDEGDIGFAFGEHLHFEVAVPTNLTTPFDTLGGFINGYNLIPVVCDIPGNLYVAGQTYVAGPCGTDSCAPSIPLASQTVDGAQAYLASNDIEFNGDEFDILNTGSVVLKAGHHIRLGPGFRARPECYFEALIRDCNETPRLPQCLPLIIDR